jgi:tRNA A37 threonylcarbamoyladenosine biosynthesis protein TsaE
MVRVDLHRERDPAALEDLALDETGEPAIMVVEWPKELAAHLWPAARRIRFEHVDETTRRITIGPA